MNYKTKLITLTSLIAVLSLTYIGSLVLDPDNKKIEGYREPVLTFDEALINKIVVHQNEKDGVLEFRETEENSYTIMVDGTEYEAAYDKVSSITNQINSLLSVRTVSKDESLFETYKLTEGKYTIEMFNTEGSLLTKWILGSDDGSGNVFFREDGSNVIKLIPNTIEYYLEQKPSYFATKELYTALGSNMINAIRLEYNGEVEDAVLVEDAESEKLTWKEKLTGTDDLGAYDETEKSKLASSALALSFVVGDSIKLRDSTNYNTAEAKYKVNVKSEDPEKGAREYTLYFFEKIPEAEEGYEITVSDYKYDVIVESTYEYLKTPAGQDVVVDISRYKFEQIFGIFLEEEDYATY